MPFRDNVVISQPQIPTCLTPPPHLPIYFHRLFPSLTPNTFTGDWEMGIGMAIQAE